MVTAPSRNDSSSIHLERMPSPRRLEAGSVGNSSRTEIVASSSTVFSQTSSPLHRANAGRAALQNLQRSAPPTRSFIDLSVARVEFETARAGESRRVGWRPFSAVREYRPLHALRQGIRDDEGYLICAWFVAVFIVIATMVIWTRIKCERNHTCDQGSPDPFPPF